MIVVNIVVLAVAVVLTVLAQLFLKRGVESLGEVDASLQGMVQIGIQIFKDLYLFGGLFLLGVSFLLWIWLVSKIQLNILYPVTVSMQLVLLALGSWLWFHETLTLTQFVGMAVIIFGIFLLAWTA